MSSVRRFKQRIDHGDVIISPSGEFVLYEDYERLRNTQGDHVPIPKSADQAELMLKMGYAWLETNAPGRLKKPASAPETKVLPEVWLIRKRGYWYRPNRAGYTSSIDEAGRYTEAEAKAEAAIEPEIMQAIPWSQALDEHLAASAENRSAD